LVALLKCICASTKVANIVETSIFNDPGADGRIILRWSFRKCDGGTWTGLIWLRIGTGGGALVKAVMNLLVP
jgi:hypothetical protein